MRTPPCGIVITFLGTEIKTESVVLFPTDTEISQPYRVFFAIKWVIKYPACCKHVGVGMIGYTKMIVGVRVRLGYIGATGSDKMCEQGGAWRHSHGEWVFHVESLPRNCSTGNHDTGNWGRMRIKYTCSRDTVEYSIFAIENSRESICEELLMCELNSYSIPHGQLSAFSVEIQSGQPCPSLTAGRPQLVGLDGIRRHHAKKPQIDRQSVLHSHHPGLVGFPG